MARVYSNTPEPRYVQYAQALIPDGTADKNSDVLIPAPLTIGTGHDSVILKATPNAADPSVDRTNVVTGDFSAVISATESAAIGGIITITGGGNNLGAGYRQTLTNCENSLSGGYRVTSNNVKQGLIFGKSINATYVSNSAIVGENLTATGGTSANRQRSIALFGVDNNAGSNSYLLASGLHNVINNSASAVIGERLITSKYGQTNVGMWNKANNQAYFVVGSGQSEAARKNCFAAGWYSEGATEEDRRVIWIGDTMISEAQFKLLLALI